MVLQGYLALTFWGDTTLAWPFRVILIDILSRYSTGVVLRVYPALTSWEGLAPAWAFRLQYTVPKRLGLFCMHNLTLHCSFFWLEHAFCFEVFFIQYSHKDCWACNHFWVVHVKPHGNILTPKGNLNRDSSKSYLNFRGNRSKWRGWGSLMLGMSLEEHNQADNFAIRKKKSIPSL